MVEVDSARWLLLRLGSLLDRNFTTWKANSIMSKSDNLRSLDGTKPTTMLPFESVPFLVSVSAPESI